MELREEHRKNRVAIAIALDRSGSMTMPVAGGKTKMDLANLGTAECVKLLSAQDMVGVIAVDSSPHVVQRLTKVTKPGTIRNRVLKIESMGGGIFVYEALLAAGKELMKANNYTTRHIILFSDAQDSEEPGDYKKLLKKLTASDITVSVIGLGKKTDVDAKLLIDVAKRGNGNIMFTQDAKELPRLFTQDTMSIARNTFLKKDEENPAGFKGILLPDARLMGDLGVEAFPKTDGYNLCYIKPDATAGVISKDEYSAPWSAFWYRGLGRVAAITLEVDGQYTGQFGTWEGYNDFLITHARWLLGGDDPNQMFVQMQRDGQDALVTVELDPDRSQKNQSTTPSFIVVPPGAERIEKFEPKFIWTGPDTLQTRFRLDRTGVFRTLIKSGARKIQRGPAITLPYSPEFAPRIGMLSGKETLEQIADVTNGKHRANILEVLQDPSRSVTMLSLLPVLFVLGVLLLILEIAGRRLSLWNWKPGRSDKAASTQPATKQATKQAKKSGWQTFTTRPKKKFGQAQPGAVAESKPADAEPKKQDVAADKKPDRSMNDLLAHAKQRAKRRLK